MGKQISAIHRTRVSKLLWVRTLDWSDSPLGSLAPHLSSALPTLTCVLLLFIPPNDSPFNMSGLPSFALLSHPPKCKLTFLNKV